MDEKFDLSFFILFLKSKHLYTRIYTYADRDLPIPSPSPCLTKGTGAVAVGAPARRPPAEGSGRAPVGMAPQGACRDAGGGLIPQGRGATAPAEHNER